MPKAPTPANEAAAANDGRSAPTKSSSAPAGALAAPASIGMTLLLFVTVAGAGSWLAYTTVQHTAELQALTTKFDAQGTTLAKLERKIGRAAEKLTASNRSIRALIEEATDVKREMTRQVRQHHAKLDRLLGRLRVFNGTVTARGKAAEKALLKKKKEGSDDEEDDEEEEDKDDYEPPVKKHNSTLPKKGEKAKKEDEEAEDEEDEDEDDEEKGSKKKGRSGKKGRGKSKKRRHGR
eukprot:Transcript_12314.p1 GENE.Transcript_12314~~Transcript_12314.p1  ORF type:complete len:236 (-),score=93.77 Transcript_12314:145-852(-)